jgi:hypothetical protein
MYPEYFGSYKIYETVRERLLKSLREVDVDKVIDGMALLDPRPEDFVKKLALALQKHVQSAKGNNIVLGVKEGLRELIDVDSDPKKITMSKHGRSSLKIVVQNRTDAMLKFRLGVEQVDRKFTALLFDPVKSFSHTKLVKSHLIEPGKAYAFKYLIKPDVFGVQDLYELKKNGKLNITLGYQVEVDGVDGMRSEAKKVDVEIVKVVA